MLPAALIEDILLENEVIEELAYPARHPVEWGNRPCIEAFVQTHPAPYPHRARRSLVAQRWIVKEPRRSGLSYWGLAEGIGDIEHKVHSPAQQLCQGPDGPSEAKGLESPHTQGVRVSDHFLVVTVRAFAGTARRIEALPREGAALDRSNEARMIFERHTMAIAEGTCAVRALSLLLGRTRSATDILPALS